MATGTATAPVDRLPELVGRFALPDGVTWLQMSAVMAEELWARCSCTTVVCVPAVSRKLTAE